MFQRYLIALVIAVALNFSTPPKLAIGAFAVGCGSACWAQIQGYCPTCNPMLTNASMPWGSPPPWWWATGPMMYSNFYTPGPWSFGPGYPGVVPGFFPRGGPVYAAKPNLYLHAPEGTEFQVKLKTDTIKDFQWLATVPGHGATGWSGKLTMKDRLKIGDATYGFLYSDYRLGDADLQDTFGFCVVRDSLIAKLALNLKKAGFDEREVADFLDFWSVKMPPAKKFCVFPQDETVLAKAAPIEISPKPISVRRVLFLIQVEEGLVDDGTKFSVAPQREWSPVPLETARMPASESKIVAREWGVGFLSSRPSVQKSH